MTSKTYDGLKLVPWESWQQWNLVREAVFSSSPARVSAALSKIAAWRARGSLPLAVEVTGDLISIHMRDPFFSDLSSHEISTTDEMLRLMYATAIMRLVNGVVDQSKKLNSASVAVRAKAAGLPRILVDIRHEVAHKELPSTSYLQLASKQAIDWLKAQYWDAQKQVLDDARKKLRDKLYAHASLIQKSQLAQSEPIPASKIETSSEKELAKLVSAAVPDVVSILQDDGLLEQCTSEKGIWRYLVAKLCSRVPELLKEIISWSIEGKSRSLSRIEWINQLVGLAHEKRLAHYVVLLAKLKDPMSNILSECNNARDIGKIVSDSETANAENCEFTNFCVSEDDVELQFKRMESSLSEARKHIQHLRKCDGNVLWSISSLNNDVSPENVDSMSQLEKHSEHNEIPLRAAWSIPDSWRSCAIGMLPSLWHSAGILPQFKNVFLDPEGDTISFDLGLQNRTEQQVSLQGDAAIADVEIKMPKVDLSNSKPKRNFSGNMIETVAKRIKPETAVGDPQEQMEVDSQMCIPIPEGDLYKDGHVASDVKQNGLQLPGLLLLDGLYQRLESEQITAIQSEIKIFD